MKKILGRGLQSLIPKRESKIINLIKSSSKFGKNTMLKKESIFNIEINKIRPNPNQPRKQISEENLNGLATSIQEHGILQPLIVTKIEMATSRGQKVNYEIVAGERRWRAAKKAGLPHVPVIIRDNSANERLEIALVENIQRENLNPIETAMAFKQLQETFNLKHEEIAKKVGKNRVTVTNYFRLLRLPSQIKDAIASGKIRDGHGRAILMARPDARLALFKKIIKNNLGIRQTEDEARRLAVPANFKGKGPKNPLFKKMESEIMDVWGRRVSITRRGDLGNLRIEFSTQKELDRLVNFLLKI
ncbi:MAG: ParB/RepB/Spo0J family partition protein [bacterium]